MSTTRATSGMHRASLHVNVDAKVCKVIRSKTKLNVVNLSDVGILSVTLLLVVQWG